MSNPGTRYSTKWATYNLWPLGWGNLSVYDMMIKKKTAGARKTRPPFPYDF
jgi:hypothetical protein